MSYPATPDDIQRFKDAFRLHPAGVALVAGNTAEGLVGLTLSSIASVSADPPVLSFSVTRSTGSAGGILSAGTFVVHFLTDEQAQLAMNFARTGSPRFTEEQGWQTLPTGEPYLPSASMALRCTIRETLPVGPSVLILANVLDTYQGEPATPLIYRDRTFFSGEGLEALSVE
ncbi:flavin reductase family protein [Leucobacter chinensis]|uniref:flavin reductase family protein n=1 Tax=Leucobacter chinensis TaxID=2851010 RepID=UPI00350EECAA